MAIPKPAILKVARTIEERDGLPRRQALRKAIKWARDKERPRCTFPNRDCQCGRPRCVEIKKPMGERDKKVCVAPSLCDCDGCRWMRGASRAKMGKYEGHAGR